MECFNTGDSEGEEGITVDFDSLVLLKTMETITEKSTFMFQEKI